MARAVQIINLLRAGRAEQSIAEREREREEKDYNTHLADISSGSARAVQYTPCQNLIGWARAVQLGDH